MKTIYNYAFRIVCIYIFVLVVFIISDIEIVTYKSNYKVSNTNSNKALESSIVMKLMDHATLDIVEEEEKEAVVEENIESVEDVEEIIQSTPTPEAVIEEKIEEPIKESTYQYVNTIDTSSYPVLQTTFGNLSHYGHDCYGCTSGCTASGYDISSGNIYYTDSTFGSVRIVAAGYEYSEGTILRLTNVESYPIIAIVLDRGGAIGSGKSFTLDLLAESNAQAYQLGIRNNVKIEMLRSGY